MTDNLSIYSDKLYSQIKVGIIIISLIVILIVLAFIWMIKNKLLQRNTAIILSVSCLLLATLIYLFEIYPLQKDINQQSYVVYEGNFYVKECKSANRAGTYIYIKSSNSSNVIRYKVSCDVDKINNNTSYMGKFVYSKNSKILVDITVE